jgi:hypothetical protein
MEATHVEATFGPDADHQTTIALWGWKGGSYLNMGPGTELGWYTQPHGLLGDVLGALGFRGVDKEGYIPEMSVSIARKSDTSDVITFAPGDQSWVGAYVARWGDLAKEDIIVTMTVDLSDNDAAFEAFDSLPAEKRDGWTFDRDTRTGTKQYRRRKKGWA